MNWQSIRQAQRYEMSPIAGTTYRLAMRRKLSRRDIRSCKPTGYYSASQPRRRASAVAPW
jgi:hypothetical protein